MIYYIIFILLFALFCFELIVNKKYTLIVKIYFFAAGIFLILFAGLRYKIGIDYASYERIHQIIRSMSWTYTELIDKSKEINQEVGFFVLNIFFKNFNMMILFIAILSLILKYKFIYEHSKFIFLSLWLYYSMFFIRYEMGLISQTIAVSIVLYSINFIITGRKYRFILTVVLASLFHYTAILFLPAYWLASRKLSLKFMFIVTIISLSLAYLPLTNLLSNFIIKLVPWYSLYFKEISEFTLSFNTIKRITILFLFIYTIKRYYPDNLLYNIYLNIYFMGVVAYFSFKSIPILSDRGTVYFMVVEIILWGILIHHYRNIVIKFCLITFLLINSIYSLYSSVNLNNNVLNAKNFNYPYIPYKSLIDQ
jgi:hypothetical protein